MRLLTFAPQGSGGTLRLGALVNGDVADLAVLDTVWRRRPPGSEPLPATMRTLLAAGEAGLPPAGYRRGGAGLWQAVHRKSYLVQNVATAVNQGQPRKDNPER